MLFDISHSDFIDFLIEVTKKKRDRLHFSVTMSINWIYAEASFVVLGILKSAWKQRKPIFVVC